LSSKLFILEFSIYILLESFNKRGYICIYKLSKTIGLVYRSKNSSKFSSDLNFSY
jgi:hypothetical protein